MAFTFEDAAHLLRRAGFGGQTQEIEALVELGLEKSVEKLLEFSDEDGTKNNPHDVEKTLINTANVGRAIRELQAFWFYKMLKTTQPLKEKLTLFWHGHFATGFDKVRNPLDLQAQNELFRKLGLGKFQNLVLAISKDPAMLRYLDNDENKKGKPNENYARELMELFTMGVGNYSEKDIQESARAFTGWSFRRGTRGIQKYYQSEFVFNQKNHDSGIKTFLGQSGNFDGTDIVRMTSQHPATSRFITTKLWKFFVSENASNQIDALSKTFTETNGNIKAVLRQIFTSKEFYSPQNRFSLVKSPVEYVVGALRGTKAELAPEHIYGLLSMMTSMAQTIFNPPDVSGWDAGNAWIADVTVLNRLTFIGALTANRLPTAGREQGQKVPAAKISWPNGKNIDETIKALGKTFFGGSLDQNLVDVLKNLGKNQGLAYLVLASPQYHLA